MPPLILGSEPTWLAKSKPEQKKSKIFFKRDQREIFGPSSRLHRKNKEVYKVPNFTENKTDRAYDSFMRHIPTFSRDPPEAETIQKGLNNSQKQPANRKSSPK